MISDVLFDAAQEIEDYLRAMPDVYPDVVRDEIVDLLDDMRRLQHKLERPPVAVDCAKCGTSTYEYTMIGGKPYCPECVRS